MAIHRFRTRDNTERFWMASGQAATPPSFRPAARQHLDLVGLRPARRSVRPAAATLRRQAAGRRRPVAAAGPAAGTADGRSCSTCRAPVSRQGLPPRRVFLPMAPPHMRLHRWARPAAPAFALKPRPSKSLYMHDGVDLVAPAGTPVQAAADGLVVGAAPNGRYGNWVRIEHGGKLASVYGHLSPSRRACSPA